MKIAGPSLLFLRIYGQFAATTICFPKLFSVMCNLMHVECRTFDPRHLKSTLGQMALTQPCIRHTLLIFGRPFVKRFALSYRTVVCLSCLYVCLSETLKFGVLWPNGWMDQDETWQTGRARPRPHCVRWGPSSLHGKGHSSPPLSKFTGTAFACVHIIRAPCLLWPSGRPSQLLLSTCYRKSA